MALNSALKLDTSLVGNGKGSIYARIATCTSTGSLTSAVYSLPVSKDSEVAISTGEVSREDESGNIYKSDGTTEASFKTVFMQSDMATRTFAKDLAGLYVAVVKEEGLTDTGKVGYIAFVGKVKKSFSMKNPGGETPIEINIPINTSAITLTGATFQHPNWLKTALGNMTIPASDFVGVTEVAYP